mmetsp:Transcript_35632/g.113938  ORF Transcript_35632/g.113938 Transcript_35632/m.113938 type:complete len:111 (-) Transcript_35632:169-501(-)
MFTMINLGVVVRRLGSFSAAAGSESGRMNLLLQVIMLVLSIVGSIVFARCLTVKVLPKLIRQDEVRRAKCEAERQSRISQALPANAAMDSEANADSSPKPGTVGAANFAP